MCVFLKSRPYTDSDRRILLGRKHGKNKHEARSTRPNPGRAAPGGACTHVLLHRQQGRSFFLLCLALSQTHRFRRGAARRCQQEKSKESSSRILKAIPGSNGIATIIPKISRCI